MATPAETCPELREVGGQVLACWGDARLCLSARWSERRSGYRVFSLWSPETAEGTQDKNMDGAEAEEEEPVETRPARRPRPKGSAWDCTRGRDTGLPVPL